MNIKVYAHKSGPLSKAFLQVVGLTDHKLVEVGDQKSADVILLTGSEELRDLYNDKQLFWVLLTERRPVAEKQPENVCLLDTLRLFDGNNGIVKLFEMIDKHIVGQAKKSATEEALPNFSDVADLKSRYSVLVVDDTERNLRIAEAVLKGHSVTTVRGLQEAMKAIGQKHFDVVLTDMEMRPDKQYSSLNLDHYGITETVPLGFAVVLEMTERGMPVAVVTDGNHHTGWVSAMFDHIREANVNGQKVLFFNSIGKRWDRALKSLMEE